MKHKIKVLLAEDEPSLGMIVKESLEKRGFSVTLCHNGAEAFTAFQNHNYHVLVLDVMMPLKDGFTLVKEIRQIDKTTPVIFLTSKSQTHDVVEGFQSGGNDYLKKPFSMEELIVRIQSITGVLNEQSKTTILKIGQFILDTEKQKLSSSDTSFFLTHRESSLLELLVRNKGEIIERHILLQNIWGQDDFFSGRSMDVFITRLRKKLASDASVQIINIRGLGYKLID